MKKTCLRLVFCTLLTVVAFLSAPHGSYAATTLCRSSCVDNYDCMACCKCLGNSFWVCYDQCA
jgi:hypothetical protein